MEGSLDGRSHLGCCGVGGGDFVGDGGVCSWAGGVGDVRGDLDMSGEELKRQVMSRVNVPVGREGEAGVTIEGWVKFFPVGYKFGPASVMACERLVRRELKLR